MTRRDNADGQPIGFVLISSDISEKMQAEEQLRTASQYARSLIEASLDPLVMVRVPCSVPAAWGEKVTLIVQEPCAATWLPQVLVSPKSALAEMLMASAAEP